MKWWNKFQANRAAKKQHKELLSWVVRGGTASVKFFCGGMKEHSLRIESQYCQAQAERMMDEMSAEACKPDVSNTFVFPDGIRVGNN